MKKFRSFADIQEGLANGSFSVSALVEYYLQNIENRPDLNAFIEVWPDEALLGARRVDDRLKAGTAGKLAGMVLGIKDVLCYKGHTLTAGSKILQGFTSQFTATALQRLLDEDAIFIGRQNCDEFAMGSSNETSVYGPSRNAADTNRVSGGSSGGSAVAVQADLCFASIGSDTGGSVRQPAAFCGVVGLKPSYSRISRYGLVAYASSFDCIGPISRCVDDAALLLEVMAGPDRMDSTSSSRVVELYSHNSPPQTYRIAYLKQALDPGALQPEMRETFFQNLAVLKAAGHTVEAIDLPYTEYFLPAYYILTTAEASSNLSRYDGIRYGYRSPHANTLEEIYKMSRSEGFGPEVKRRILLGTFTLSAGYFDAYYTKAQKVRRLVKNSAEEIFNQFDFLLMPTTPTTAFEIGQKVEDPTQAYLADVFTVWANLSGVPAISIPKGEDASGMPIGLQAHAAYFKEKKLLDFARLWENLPHR